MSSDILSTLQNLDPALLTSIVRKQQNSPAFEISDGSVSPISHAALVDTTGGLFRFDGLGSDSQVARSWSVALKILHDPKEWAQEPRGVFYWKREFLAAQSGLLQSLPLGVRAPHIYDTMDNGDDCWVWTEYVDEATDRRWSLEHFKQVAYHVGHFGGAFLNGLPIPDQPWLCNAVHRSLLSDETGWLTMMDPDSPNSIWQHPQVQSAFPDPLRAGVIRLFHERERFFTALDRLPQVFCHNDFHRRNIMLTQPAEGDYQVVAVDWAWCGRGAVGVDLGGLVATSLYFLDADPAHAPELEAASLESYIAGLRDSGWSGDVRLARLGYLLSVSLWHGAALPGWTAIMLPQGLDTDTMPMYNHPADQVLAKWVTLQAFLLERADQARSLMHELNLG